MVRLSIIIPTRDRPELLRDCLGTIQRQDVEADSVEVVVVDDGSRQPLDPVVADAAGPISIRCVRQAPGGLNAARNRGIEETSGEAVAFLDDDTLLAPQWARAMLETFEASACAAVGGRVQLGFEGGAAPAWLARTQREYLAEFYLGPEPLRLDHGPVPVGANCAVRRAEFDRVGAFEDGLDRIGSSLISNGDTEFFRRLRRSGGHIRYEPAAAVIHRVPAERLTREFFLRRAHAQGVSDALLAAHADTDPRAARVAREVWRCGRTGPILIRGLATGRGTMNARQWVSYCRGRLETTVTGAGRWRAQTLRARVAADEPLGGLPLRMLAVGNMYPPHHAGGYELAWQAAMSHARAQGHTVRILTSDYEAAPDRDEEDPDVHRTLRWYWDPARHRFVRQGRLARVRLERHNAAELRRHLRAFRPDVVAWWSMGCMSLSLIEQVRRAGIPGVCVVHDDWLSYGWQNDPWSLTWRGRRPLLGRVAERLCGVPTDVDIGAAGPLVFNSRYTREHASHAGVDVSAATVVHPGIHERFLAAATPHPWRWRLLYVGRIDRRKGIDTAVAALANLPSAATLTVWGSGDEAYAAELRALARRIGVGPRLQFEGFAAAEALPAVYAGADAVVFPVRWEEPFGLVPLEAMGVGRPVVATSRGGAAEFLGDGENALIFPPDDAAGLAACIERLAGDDALRARLREGGARTAARYTMERFAARTVREIEHAARGSVRRTARRAR